MLVLLVVSPYSRVPNVDACFKLPWRASLATTKNTAPIPHHDCFSCYRGCSQVVEVDINMIVHILFYILYPVTTPGLTSLTPPDGFSVKSNLFSVASPLVLIVSYHFYHFSSTTTTAATNNYHPSLFSSSPKSKPPRP